MVETIIENWKMLVIETQEQVKLTHGLLSNFQPNLLDKIAAKDDYIDNLKTVIENTSFRRIHGPEFASDKDVNAVRAIHVICLNLERIADYCVNIARQTRFLSRHDVIHEYDYREMFAEIQEALMTVTQVFREGDLTGALKLCRAEFDLDTLYKKNFDQILKEMEAGRGVRDLITVLFIFRYLERIGDSILNIGEALIFSIIGDRIKIRQFDMLQKTLEDSGFNGTLEDIDFSSIWGSRSGCRISRVKEKAPNDFKAQGIFKEGNVRKIHREEQNIRQWQEIFPGLAPKIFGYYEKGDTASLLVEHLPGCTMDQAILTADDEIVQNAFFMLEQTILQIWETTRKNAPVATDYMDQLQARLPAVLRVHEQFHRKPKRLGGLFIPSTEDMIARCADIEKRVPAPFSVRIHGDFNVNNLVYNHEDQRIHFIDLYRSRDADYVQDASVFLVSNFRLPVFEPQLRERIDRVIAYFFKVFERFARNSGDDLFHIRTALALARSFYTSARFELNDRFAGEMYLKSTYLMETVINHKDSRTAYRLPDTVLYCQDI